VLFEMLTGRRTFGGEDVTEVLAAVVRADPDWSALPADTPRAMVTLLRRSLRKDPQQRLPNLSAARLDIDDAISSVGAEPSGYAEKRPRSLSPRAVATTAGLMAVSAGLAWMLTALPAPATRDPVRVQVTLPAADELHRGARNLAVSPDGHTLAYVAVRDGVSGLYVRPLAVFDATLLAGTEGAYNPFFSPDGRWLGFFAQDKMKRIAVNGGAAATIVEGLGVAPGASWSADNTIVYSPSLIGRSGLWRVSADGGTPAALTTPDAARGEYSHRYPHILPGGRAVLFTSLSGFGWDETNVEALILETGERRVLVRGGQTAQYVPGGHLLYVRAGTLLDVSFDPARLEVGAGDPVAIAAGVMQNGGPNGSLYAASASGTIAYAPAPGGTRLFERQLVWIDRRGRQSPTRAPPRNYTAVALSPDGEGIVVTIGAGTDDLWRYDPGRDLLAKLTTGPRSSREAVWSPDGRNIAYRSNATGLWQIHSIPADGSAAQGTPLLVSAVNNWPTSFSPDGRTLAFVQNVEATRFDAWTLPLDGDRTPQPFAETTAVESPPQFSPNGRWLAYASDASGGVQVYVAPFPGPGRRIQVSTDGGDDPQWHPKGGELFYRNANRTMVVPVTTAGTFAAGRPSVLYEGPSGQVSPDGQRFLAIAAIHGEQVNQINVMINVLK
jgi:Tol biopolymer transport system component